MLNGHSGSLRCVLSWFLTMVVPLDCCRYIHVLLLLGAHAQGRTPNSQGLLCYTSLPRDNLPVEHPIICNPTHIHIPTSQPQAHWCLRRRPSRLMPSRHLAPRACHALLYSETIPPVGQRMLSSCQGPVSSHHRGPQQGAGISSLCG